MAVAQLVESRIVIPVVVGSSPISHPKTAKRCNRNVAALFALGRRLLPCVYPFAALGQRTTSKHCPYLALEEFTQCLLGRVDIGFRASGSEKYHHFSVHHPYGIDQTL